MVTIVEIDKSTYRVGGTKQYQNVEFKQVVVDGETYSRTNYTDAIIDFDVDFSLPKRTRNWTKIELDAFAFLGIPNVVFWDYEFLHSTAQENALGQYSKNRVVNLYYALQDEYKIFGDEIVIYFGKSNYGRRSVEELFFAAGKAQVIGFTYGFACALFAEVSMETFLSSDFLEMPHEIKWAYENLIPEIKTVKRFFSDDQKFDISARLLDLLIEKNT